MSKGWIKLKRSLLDWEWYDDHNATRLLIHLLVSVNYQPKKWKGIMIQPGSMVLSWETLSGSSGLSVRQCRTAMKKLEESGEITRSVTNKFQLITLVKWEEIQMNEQEADNQEGSQMTDKCQANDKQMTTTKERKEIKKEKNKERKTSFSAPTIEEVFDFMIEKGTSEPVARRESEKFWFHYDSKNWMIGKNKMKIWKSAVSGWINRMNEYQKPSGQNDNQNLSKTAQKMQKYVRK